MKRLNDWLAREATRQARHPRLEHALLTDRAAAYVFYRLQFMGLRVFVRCAVYLLEIMLLASAMVPPTWLAVFIGYRTATGLLSSLYWGALEQMRERVREHLRLRHVGSARLEIHNWLRVSLLLGVLAVAAAAAWVALRPSIHHGLSVFDLFALACATRLAFDLWARTLHSGIFATRRVYRPIWSLLLPDVIEFALLVVLFPRFDLLAFPVMVGVGGAVRIGLSNYFSKRAYRSSRLAVPSFLEALRSRHALTGTDLATAAKFTLSNATSQLDGLMIMLILFAVPSGAGEGAGFASAYYVLRPLMAVAHGWARAFYFDFQRLDGQVQLLQRRFRRLMFRTALALAALVALMVLGATVLLSGGVPSASLWVLAPFFVARSLMSLRQLDAFVSGRHLSLLGVSVVLLVTLVPIAWFVRDELVVMIAATLLMLLAYLALAPKGKARAPRRMVTLPRWLSLLGSEPGPVCVTAMTVDRRVTTVGRLIRRLSAEADHAVFARFGRGHLLVFEPAAEAVLGSTQTAVVLADGAILAHASSFGSTGSAALHDAFRSTLPRALVSVLDRADTPDLLRAFQQAHPAGTVLDAQQGRVLGGKSLTVRELRAVVGALAAQGNTNAERSSIRVQVAAYAPAGEPETVFIAPRNERMDRDFRSLVHAATLRASLRDTPAGAVAQRRP